MDELTGQLALANLITTFMDKFSEIGRPNLTAGLIRGRLELLDRYWSKFMRTHSELRRHDQLWEHAYFKEDVYASTEIHYGAALGCLYDEQSRLSVIPQTMQPETVRAASTSASVHLPKIRLPSFSGAFTEWESFRDLFRSMIHENQSLTPVQKLHYLKTSVHGDAKIALEGIQVTDANYTTAWNLLLKRFDNKRLLVHQHLSLITSMPTLKDESASGLKSLLDLMIKGRDALVLLDRPASDWDDWFVFFTTKAMDPVTRRDWERNLGDNDTLPTLEKLSIFVQGRIRALQAVEPPRSASRGSRHRSTRSSVPEPGRRAQVCATPIRTAQCPACNEGHYIGYCPKLTMLQPAERRVRVMRLRLCFNCLRPGHVRSQCCSERNCSKCSARHHTLLHKAQDGKRRAERAVEGRVEKTPRPVIETMPNHGANNARPSA